MIINVYKPKHMCGNTAELAESSAYRDVPPTSNTLQKVHGLVQNTQDIGKL